MSEILKRYKEKNKYLENLTKSYQDLVASMISHPRALVKGDKNLENALDKLLGRVKSAQNIFQVQQIQKDYTQLCKKIDAAVKEKGKAGGGGLLSGLASILGGREGKKEQAPALEQRARKPEKIDLVDATREILSPYVTLLDGFSKGTILLADEREPFFDTLNSERARRFEGLKVETADGLSRSLYNFFINKSNEASLVEQEKEELKAIIGSLAGYIQSLSVSSESYGAKLDNYSKKIISATSLDEIKKIQHAILAETLEIQKANTEMREKFVEANMKVAEAGEKIARLEKELMMARQEKAVDSLTRVFNRGYFDERIKEAVAQFKRTGESCCLIMLDIDSFKDFNDTYGHQAGDQVLAKIAEIIKESVRASDTVARYGGEEFALILYRARLKNAMKMAENIRKNVRLHEFVVLDKVIRVTVSMGVTEFTPADEPKDIIERADKGLYEAKREGRDRIVRAGE